MKRKPCKTGLQSQSQLVLLAGVGVEDDKEEEEESLAVALQEHLCWSTGLVKLVLSCCWAHWLCEAATSAAADKAAAAAACLTHSWSWLPGSDTRGTTLRRWRRRSEIFIRILITLIVEYDNSRLEPCESYYI